jgi:hypothetical protein
VEKMDINPMNAQIKGKKVVKLTLPKHKDGMLRWRMLKAEDH